MMETQTSGSASGNGTYSTDGIAEDEPYSPGRNLQSRASRLRDPFSRVDDQTLVQGLAWFSVGLGLTALLAPRSLGNLAGLGGRSGLVRMVGARELASGIGLLSSRNSTPWLWSRVAGDAMDILTLGAAALKPTGGGNLRALTSLALVAGVTAADVSASLRYSSKSRGQQSRRLSAEDYIERSTTIKKSPQECYDLWRRQTNAPQFMRHVQSVTEVDEKTSRWVARLPGGQRVEWESRITDDVPGKRIAWHSLPQSPIVHAGAVSFDPAPAGRGTIVRVVFHYRPPVTPGGIAAARPLSFVPAFEISEDLRCFKQLLETGELATTRGQPTGRRSLIARMVGAGRGK
jgi:uncharacterized membrane protein